MKTFLLCAALISSAASAQALKTDDEKSLYAFGYRVGSQNMQPLALKQAELEIFKRGFTDGALGKKAAVEQDQQKVQEYLQGRSHAAADKEKVAGREFAEKAAKEQGATKLPGGTIIKTIKPGDGPSPQPTDKVKVNYEGKLTNGTVFDSSYKRGQPAEFPLNGVIKCWTEGVGHMKVNEKAKLTCPSDIAYGDSGHPPGIPGGATLVFEVELLAIQK